MENLFQLLDQTNGTPRHLRRGDVLFHEDNQGNSFYLVRHGRLRALRGINSESPVVLGEIGRGEIIGEMAVLTGELRSASVIALRDTELTEFSGADLAQLPRETLLAVMSIIATRLRRLMDREHGNALPSCVAVVPVQQGLPTDDYCAHLVESLKQAGGQCLWIRREDLPSQFSAMDSCDSDAFNQLGEWLDDRERGEAMLLLQTDYDVTPWTERCLRQADLILLLAVPKGEPIKSPTERAIERLPGTQARPRLDLVLLQDEPPYRNTAAWLADRQITRHHHVRLHNAEDRSRAGRLLTGRDVSFALGGGGARGFAHIGVLRACQEMGIPVDRVCGTSMGSIVAGLAALGLPWEEITDRLRTHLTVKRKLVNYTLPLLSFDTGRGYIRALERLFGDTCIEDLPINYFCVSCNLTHASVMIHRTGPMTKWIGASVSVPGIAPPLVEHGELLVDGGLLNNLPVDVAKADGAGRVVGVDVSPSTEFRLPASYSGRPRTWEVLWSRISGRKICLDSANSKPVFPTLAGILHRATGISSVYQQDKLIRKADFYIKVPVDRFRLLEFESIDAISEIGYATGLEKLVPVADWTRSGRLPDGMPPAP